MSMKVPLPIDSLKVQHIKLNAHLLLACYRETIHITLYYKIKSFPYLTRISLNCFVINRKCAHSFASRHEQQRSLLFPVLKTATFLLATHYMWFNLRCDHTTDKQLKRNYRAKLLLITNCLHILIPLLQHHLQAVLFFLIHCKHQVRKKNILLKKAMLLLCFPFDPAV